MRTAIHPLIEMFDGDSSVTAHDPKSGLLRRVWQSFLETSEVAVAVHYRAPWHVPAGVVPVAIARPSAAAQGKAEIAQDGRATPGAPRAVSDAHAEVLGFHKVLEPVL